MTHGSLFSGVGGFDLAAKWMGWENKFHCEWNPFGQEVLKYYHPNAISYNDITTTDFSIWRGKIDILTGGFPCQPFSTAGKRKGTGDSRYLWPEMLRVIREVRPQWVVGENVYGLVNWDGGLVFDTVCLDLENEGFKVVPVVLPACGVNAPHQRYRIWFIAHADHQGGGDGFGQIQGENGEIPQRNHHAEFSDPGECVTTNPLNEGLQGSKIFRGPRGSRSESHQQSSGCFCPTWEEFPTQSPLCGRNDGFPSGLSGITISKHRQESIKAYGNAIVPQLAYQIFKTIMDVQTTSGY